MQDCGKHVHVCVGEEMTCEVQDSVCVRWALVCVCICKKQHKALGMVGKGALQALH